MRSHTKTLIGVVTMSILLALYISFALYRVFILFASKNLIGALLGLGLLVLSLIAVLALARELLFGYHANRLTRELEKLGALPEDGLPVQWNGMPRREDALAILPKYQAASQEESDDWRNWQRYGILLRAAGKNSEARAAIRHAIKLERAKERGSCL